jgi:hypothetical protein
VQRRGVPHAHKIRQQLEVKCVIRQKIAGNPGEKAGPTCKQGCTMLQLASASRWERALEDSFTLLGAIMLEELGRPEQSAHDSSVGLEALRGRWLLQQPLQR